MTQKELESYLWGAATLLRGLIDASDYKQYVFPLLFFKRLSDVWDGDYREAFGETSDEGYATATANDRFVIPDGAHWKDARNASRDVGRALLNAFQAIEAANPERLKGVFGNAAWTDKAQMPDETLKNLIEHFSQHTLSLENVPEDELGNGYEYLIKQFADDSGHTAQEFYTNRTLVHLMAQMLEPQPGETIYDPTCGTGGMLISCLAEVKRNGGDTRTMGLYGQELINISAAIARMNLVLHGVSDFDIRSGNTLHEPALLEGDRLRTFDVVLANPPYSIKKWNRDAWQSDPWGRNFLGTPPQGRADYAFFQHILKSMDPRTGRCAILFPHGVLFRKDEAELRRRLVETDMVECVLGLGANLFYNSPMEACVVICRATKPSRTKERTLFIDAPHEVIREGGQSYLLPDHRERILKAYEDFQTEPGFTAVARTADILANGGDLSVHHYVERSAKRGSAVSELPEMWERFEGDGRTLWMSLDHFVQDFSRDRADLRAQR
ncbi:MAG: class I SAM-dependent DNA methyltransferase [Acidimicrobiales bacterium]